MWTDKPCCVGSDCHLVLHLWCELVMDIYVNPFDVGSTQMCFTQLFVRERTFIPLRLFGATLVCNAQIMLMSITLVASHQLACDVGK